MKGSLLAVHRPWAWPDLSQREHEPVLSAARLTVNRRREEVDGAGGGNFHRLRQRALEPSRSALFRFPEEMREKTTSS